MRNLMLLAVILCACGPSAPSGGGLPLGYDTGDATVDASATCLAPGDGGAATCDPGCATACKIDGRCWKVDGECHPKSDADCAGSDFCADPFLAHCKFDPTSGYCRNASDL